MGPVDESRKRHNLLGVILLFNGSLARHWHAERDCFLALLDVAAFVLPAHERGDRPRLDSPCETLAPGKQLIPDAVGVELAVSARDDAGFCDCGLEELRDRWGHGPPWREGHRPVIMAGAVSQFSVGCRLGAFACYQHADVPSLTASSQEQNPCLLWLNQHIDGECEALSSRAINRDRIR